MKGAKLCILHTEHQGIKGCLSEEPSCWSDQVDFFFVEAMEVVKQEDCEKLSEKVSQKLNIPLIRPVLNEQMS